jgi:hypothetical protein
MTSVRFEIMDDSFNIMYAARYFDKINDLIHAIGITTDNTTMPFPPGQTQNVIDVGLWIEYRVVNSTIDIIACDGGTEDEERVGCVYSTVSMLHFRQPVNEQILQKMNSSSFYSEDRFLSSSPSSYMTLEAFTGANKGDDTGTNTTVPASIEKMKKDTAAVADYMAQLGYNYYAKFDSYGGKLYMQYKVEDPMPGLEVPFWVLIVAGIILILGCLLWQLTYLLIGSPHNSSLYSIIRTRLASRSNTPIPKLMRFQYEPLMFEDIQLLPDHDDRAPEEDKLLPDNVKSV